MQHTVSSTLVARDPVCPRLVHTVRARADMHRLKSEDLSAEADAWVHDTGGSVKIVGTKR